MHFIKSNLLVLSILIVAVSCADDILIENTAVSSQNDLFTIIGKVNIRPEDIDLENTRILVDDGLHVGHLRADGTFSISGLASNSYVVEISSPKNYFEPVRVDITTKGKIRSRRLNLIQPTEIQVLKYPLNFESRGYPNYFLKREQFRILDILMSPMVLMMVVPLLLVVVLPKLVNQDPEIQREFEQSQQLLTPPDVSGMISNFFGGAGGPKKPATNRPSSGQQQQQQQQQRRDRKSVV